MTKNEIIVKKSRFIGYCVNIENEQQAKEYVEFIRQKENDRHVCYAYFTNTSAGFSDDGEPKGTAGKAIYSLMQLKKITNTIVIVARYFGGIKLGAGGLTRAYRECANEVINLHLNNIQR
ncbi:YigZ family protein [Mycoplasma corogypsi]|uniref:YigZ family protein n=1 Tax=Mycoplasma corogypsi TaxID=2106 RepID=UPI0038736E7A